MDYKDIKKLMDDMGQSKLSEVEIEFPDGTKVSLKKNEETKIVSEIPQTAVSIPVQAETASKQEEKKLDGNVVKSPMDRTGRTAG